MIEAIIERAKDGTFSVYCLYEPFSGMGETPDAAKTNMIEAMQFHKEGCMADGCAYPGFLDNEFEIAFTIMQLKFFKVAGHTAPKNWSIE